MKSLFTALTLGVFAIALAAPVALDLDAGVLTAKAAYAKDGADDGPDGPDDNGGHGGDDGPDGPDDNGGHGGDDGPDGPDDNGGHGGDDGAGHK